MFCIKGWRGLSKLYAMTFLFTSYIEITFRSSEDLTLPLSSLATLRLMHDCLPVCRLRYRSTQPSRKCELLYFENINRAQQDNVIRRAAHYGYSMKSLYCIRLHQALITLFKCLSGTGPTYIGNLFKHRHTPYGLRGEGLNLELPNFHLKFKNNSFTYLLTKL